jgi:RNA polymerase sigma-70 factor (ECF subfamily)
VNTGTTTGVQGCIDRLRAGDPAARDELFRHAADRLQRLARHMLAEFTRLRGVEQTADVVQSASMRLLRALEAAPPASTEEFFRLAATQIRRELIDLYRHHFGRRENSPRRQPSVPVDARSDTPPLAIAGGTTFNPDRLAAWTEFHEQVGRLPDDERTVFELLWYEGLAQGEAAAVLGISLATVKRRWMAARLRLRDHLPGPAVPHDNRPD